MHFIDNITNEEFYKVGISIRPDRRVKELSRSSNNQYSITLIKTEEHPAMEIYAIEQLIHKRLKDYKHDPVHTFHGSTECFKPESLSIIMESFNQ
jgi:hypothetical protein